MVFDELPVQCLGVDAKRIRTVLRFRNPKKIATVGTALLLAAGAAAYALLALLGAPRSPHPYFEAERGTQVIAHRGGAGLRPENTLAAFQHAAELGAEIVEMDARVAADGAIVVIHDATVDRTTDGIGPVAALTLAELRRLDAGYRWSPDGGRSFPYRGRGLRVPALEEVLERVPSVRMVVEMKQFEPPSAAALCALVRRSGMQRKVLVASFAAGALRAFRGACPEVATSMSAFEARLFVTLRGLYTPAAAALQLPDRMGDTVLVTPEMIALARGHNVKVHAWTVNDEARLRELVHLGIDGIMTDRPDRLLALTRPSSGLPKR
jgi:glycerophosphoryl diester phosphodiesterase